MKGHVSCAKQTTKRRSLVNRLTHILRRILHREERFELRQNRFAELDTRCRMDERADRGSVNVQKEG